MEKLGTFVAWSVLATLDMLKFIYGSWVILQVWNWFLLDSFQPITIQPIMGILLLLALYRYNHDSKTQSLNGLAKKTISGYIVLSVMLGLGWILKTIAL